jgi:dTDP-4-amino-4,6-dideoxygalactose transaminase
VAREDFRVPEQALGSDGLSRPWYYEMQDLGFNYRITDLQCALGHSQLRRLDRFVARRRELVERYGARLSSLRAAGSIVLPAEADGRESAWHLYPIRIRRRRDTVYRELRDRGIGTQVHYLPVHLQPYYRDRFGTRGGLFPEAERWFGETLSLPLFPAMADADVDRVAEILTEILAPPEEAA